jgi:hypothetical protein
MEFLVFNSFDISVQSVVENFRRLSVGCIRLRINMYMC